MIAGCLVSAPAPQISRTSHAAGELKEAAAVFIVAGSLSLTLIWSLSASTPREHMAPQAPAGGGWPLEGRHLQTVSLPSAGASREGASAAGTPKLPASPQPRPGPQAATCPEGSPLGTVWYPSPGRYQVIYFLEC